MLDPRLVSGKLVPRIPSLHRGYGNTSVFTWQSPPSRGVTFNKNFTFKKVRCASWVGNGRVSIDQSFPVLQTCEDCLDEGFVMVERRILWSRHTCWWAMRPWGQEWVWFGMSIWRGGAALCAKGCRRSRFWAEGQALGLKSLVWDQYIKYSRQTLKTQLYMQPQLWSMSDGVDWSVNTNMHVEWP